MRDLHIVTGRWLDDLRRLHIECSCGQDSYGFGAELTHDQHIADAIRAARAADKVGAR